MPSNEMYACVTCRVGGKNPYPACSRDGHDVKCFGRRITIPKKNNTRAWKRIEKGEYLWDRRKVFKSQKDITDSIPIWEFEVWQHTYPSGRVAKFKKPKGIGRYKVNFNRSPDADLGG